MTIRRCRLGRLQLRRPGPGACACREGSRRLPATERAEHDRVGWASVVRQRDAAIPRMVRRDERPLWNVGLGKAIGLPARD
eukprot:SAG11_NODE_618_length_8174_cov_41.665718_9_plen_81_part_00